MYVLLHQSTFWAISPTSCEVQSLLSQNATGQRPKAYSFHQVLELVQDLGPLEFTGKVAGGDFAGRRSKGDGVHLPRRVLCASRKYWAQDYFPASRIRQCIQYWTC